MYILKIVLNILCILNIFSLVVGKKIDRLPVVVKVLETGEEQLLGIAALQCGTGKGQSDAIHKLAVDRKVADNIVGMSFDTTSSNTGCKIGACVLLEEALGRTLLRLPCRHHIMELPIKAGFNALIPPSNSPTITLFDRFAKFWDEVDHGNVFVTNATFITSFFSKSLFNQNYIVLSTGNHVTALQLQVFRRIKDADEIVKFCNTQLEQVRIKTKQSCFQVYGNSDNDFYFFPRKTYPVVITNICVCTSSSFWAAFLLVVFDFISRGPSARHGSLVVHYIVYKSQCLVTNSISLRQRSQRF